jgi:hypothetical protein
MSKLTNDFSGHNPLEKGKYAEIRKFINTWLTDQSVYCNSCGAPFFGEACCDSPQIGKNIDHCWAVITQNKARQDVRANAFASNATKTMRLGLSMPEGLLRDLERFCQEKLGQKLFVNQKDFRGFCRSFPMFMIMEKI